MTTAAIASTSLSRAGHVGHRQAGCERETRPARRGGSLPPRHTRGEPPLGTCAWALKSDASFAPPRPKWSAPTRPAVRPLAFISAVVVVASALAAQLVAMSMRLSGDGVAAIVNDIHVHVIGTSKSDQYFRAVLNYCQNISIKTLFRQV